MITSYTTNDLLFAYWVKRKNEILSEDNGMWRGVSHTIPDALHVAIDNELNRLRPLRNPSLSVYLPRNYDKRVNTTVEQNPCTVNENMFQYE